MVLRILIILVYCHNPTLHIFFLLFLFPLLFFVLHILSKISLILFFTLLLHYAYSECPEGTFQFTNESWCYKIVADHTKWFEAEVGCLAQRGFLATIDNALLNNFLTNLVYGIVTQSSGFWVGGTTLFNVDGQWNWADASRVAYTNWASDRPVNNSQGNCVSVNITNGLWTSVSCEGDVSQPYVCELPATPANQNSLCDNGWTYNNLTGKCYFIDDSSSGLFEDNRQVCQQNYSADLVTIHSWAENLMVGSTYSLIIDSRSSGQVYFGATWIGLQQVGGAWQWVDGTAANYTNFGTTPFFGNNTGGYALLRGIEGYVYDWEQVTDSYTNWPFCQKNPNF